MAGFQRADGSPVSDISLTSGAMREVFLWGGGPDNQPLLLRSTRPNVAAIVGQVSAGWPLFKLSIKGVAPGETQIQGTVVSGIEIGKQWVQPLIVKVGAASTDDFDTKFVQPAPAPLLRVGFFWSDNTAPDPDPGPRLLAVAERMLKEHGLIVNVSPGPSRSPQATIPFGERVFLQEHVEQLRDRAQATNLTSPDRLVVIFCRFQPGFGEESRAITKKRVRGFQNFILINTDTSFPNGVTLLHEMGHAAGAEHVKDAANMMAEGDGLQRTTIFRFQVKQFANAFFSGR